MSHTLLVCNGDLEINSWFIDVVNSSTRVVAVDGGANYLQQISHLPDLYIGDKDSINSQSKIWLEENSVLQEVFPVEKDKTDLELALTITGSDMPVKVVGGLGGRVDHLVGNLFLLDNKNLSNSDICFISERQTIRACKNDIKLNSTDGEIVSLIPLNGSVRVASTHGFKWNLNDYILEFGSSRGVSNVFTSDTARIRLDSGCLLVIQSKN